MFISLLEIITVNFNALNLNGKFFCDVKRNEWKMNKKKKKKYH